MKLIILPFLLVIFLAKYVSADPNIDRVRIGVPLPLSGELAAYGEDSRNSFVVAKDILGADRFDLIFEDDRCDGSQSVTVAQKLLNIDRVDAIAGMYCNNALLPAAPIYRQKGVPVITTCATTGDVKGIGPKIFRLFPADHLGVRPLVNFITQKHYRLCLLTVTEAFTELIERTVKQEYSALRAPFALYTESLVPSTKDFRSTLLRLSKNSCDAYFLNPPGDDSFITLVRQVHELKLSAPIFAFYHPGSSTVQKALGDELDGIVYADIPSYSEVATNLGREFIAAYKKRFGDFKVGQPAGLLSFEALRLIVEAYKANQPVDQYIRGRKISDGAIKEYSFDEDGAVQGVDFKIRHYESKK